LHAKVSRHVSSSQWGNRAYLPATGARVKCLEPNWTSEPNLGGKHWDADLGIRLPVELSSAAGLIKMQLLLIFLSCEICVGR
jgi:hypothetical protein